MSKEDPILIVGGGLGGLATALALGRIGERWWGAFFNHGYVLFGLVWGGGRECGLSQRLCKTGPAIG